MATSISDQPSQLESAGSGYSKTSRRQYQSCDQCRKSRRACDAATLRVANFPLGDDDSSDPSECLVDACSNCARTSKKCTFEWLRTLPKQSLPKGVKRKLGLNEPCHPPAAHPTSNTSEAGYHSHYHNSTVNGSEFTKPPLSRSSTKSALDSQNIPLEPQRSTYPTHGTSQNGSVRASDIRYPQSQPSGDRYPQDGLVRAPDTTLNGFDGAQQRHNGNLDPPVLTRYETSSSSSSSSSADSTRFGQTASTLPTRPSLTSVLPILSKNTNVNNLHQNWLGLHPEAFKMPSQLLLAFLIRVVDLATANSQSVNDKFQPLFPHGKSGLLTML